MDEILLSVCGRTDRGRVREENQDAFLVLDLAGGEGDAVEGDVGPACDGRRFALGDEGAVFLVADGVGGRAGGARASRLATDTVRAAMADEGAESIDFPVRLAGALLRANRAIHDESARSDDHAGMGTTATLAGVTGGRVYVAQVGDSRAYLLRGSSITRLTRDQSLMQDLIDSGIFTEDDAKPGADNMLLQALGPAPRVRPAVTWHDLRRGDVLLLCSDGLSGVVRDHEIRDAASGAESEDALCERLVTLANGRGGPDNITVVAVRFDGAGLIEPGVNDPMESRPYALPEEEA